MPKSTVMNNWGVLVAMGILLFFILLPAKGRCAAKDLESVTLQLNSQHQFEFAGYYAAKAQGFYQEQGLDVEFLELGSNTSSVDEVVRGRADFGIGLSDLILLAMQGQPIVLVSNFFKHSPVFVLAGPEIHGLSDLTHKTIMGTPNDLRIAELAYMFKANKVNVNTLKWIPNSFDVNDIQKGRADAMVACVTKQPFQIQGTHDGFTRLTPSDFGADFLGDTLFTSKGEIEKHPGRAARLALATRQGWEYALEHSEDVISLIRSDYAPDKGVESLRFEVSAIKKLMLPATYEIGSIDYSRIQRIAEIFVELNMADPGYDLTGIILDIPGKGLLRRSAVLTPSELSFLKEKSVVTVAFEDNLSPLSFVTDQGHQGFSMDYFELLSEKTGVQFLPKFGSWATNLDLFKARKVDLIDGISFDKKRQKFTLFTFPYYTIPLTLFTRNDFGSYFNLPQLFGKRIGVVRDIYFKETLARYPEIDLMELSDTEALMRGLSVGLVDAVITNMVDGISIIRKLGLANVRSAGGIDLDGKQAEDLRIGVRIDMPDLFSIIKKGMAAITPAEFANLRDKWLLPASADTGSSLHLTDKEKDFLVNHQVIRVGNEENWPPFDLNVGGEAQGFGVDLMKLIAARTGIQLEFVGDLTWDETVAMFYEKKIDVLHSLSRNQEREKYALFSSQFYQSPHVLMCARDAMPITRIQDLYGKTLAMPEQWAVADYLRKHHPQIKLMYMDNTMDALSAVAQKRAFGTIEQAAVLQYFMRKYGFTSLKQAFSFDEFDNLGNASMYIAVRNDWPLLRDLVDKALKTVSPGEIAELEMKWFGQVSRLNHSGGQLDLSKKEEAYLKELNGIKFCLDSERMPFEGENGTVAHGMVVDFISLFGKKLGIPFCFVSTPPGKTSLEMLKSGQCDVLPMVAVSHLMDDSLEFTDPYLSLSVGIIVNETFPFIAGVNDLAGKAVGVARGSQLWKSVTGKFPLVGFREVQNVTQGLLDVSSGKLSALISDLPVASHYIGKLGLTNLKVVGHLDRLKELGMATQRESSQLNRILRKLVHSLTREEVDDIYQSWITLRFEHRLTYKTVWKYLLIALVLFLGILFWNRKLATFNRQMAEANVKLERLAATDRLTGIYNRMKIDKTLLKEMQRVLRYNHPLSLILMDVDFFKSVNDTYGHIAGDAVLVHMAKTIQKNIRSTDICGRWGGEEFMVICPDTDLTGAGILAEHLRQTIAMQTFFQVKTQTGSFGIAQYQEGDTEADLISRADKAMYLAKERGRNRVESIC